MTRGLGHDPDATIQDVDIEQADLYSQGTRDGRVRRRVLALIADGRLEDAAAVCTHKGGYPLDSDCARQSCDPRAGEDGVRCGMCGSALTCFPGAGGADLIGACEIRI